MAGVTSEELVQETMSATAPDLSASAGPPAHVRIEQWLTGLIDAGDLLVGTKLPKEKDLAASLGVSRMTLRQSLGSLESRGVVERIPGRQGGTFIRRPPIECDITGLAGFTEQLRRGQVRASARVVSAAVIPAARTVALALELPTETDVYEVVRVRSARRRPLALERSYLPAELFPALLDKGLSGSLYARMRRDYDLAPHSATEYLEPFIATNVEAGLLEVEGGSALLLIERTARTTGGQPVEYARDLFRPDRIRICVHTVAGETGALRSATPLSAPPKAV
ncbi:MAG: GntR family transcriptional regulator [Propionibacteriales bacterium]|nr:GntR family transcriptional regulator [Propionibacteriales bacterium]